MWRNDIKCKCMFMFPLKNLALKGLRVDIACVSLCNVVEVNATDIHTTWPPYSRFKSYVFWLPAWWALWLLWWPLTDAAMFQCVYGYLQSVFFFLVLFHYCILLEIKLTTTTTWSSSIKPYSIFRANEWKSHGVLTHSGQDKMAAI